jgi:proteasome lid subunit RPN8/RPN11
VAVTRAEIHGRIDLDRRTFDALVAHARSDAPYEVCGLLAFSGDRADAFYPIPNADRSMTSYTMDREAMHKPYLKIDQSPNLGLGIFHSHTHTEAFPSPTDVEQAGFNPQAVFLIASLQDPEDPVLRAFDIVDGKITERTVFLDGAEAPAGKR